ncbi:MAG: M6 family metalloprotease domain-containing protein, partial [Bacteroidota bacterium]
MAVKVTQPNGKELSLFVTGDEYYQRLHDAQDYTILKNSEGWYVYATLQDGIIVPGDMIIGQGDPKDMGVKPGLKISPEKWKQLRDEFWKNTPQAKISDVPLNLNTGTVNNLVVFIRFSDQTAFGENFNYYDSIFNYNVAGVNSMYNYFKEVSYNNMTVTSTFYPSPSGSLVLSYQDLLHARSYFMPYDVNTNTNGYQNDSERTTREHNLLRAAVTYIASQVPVGLNLDFNGDGLIDNVCFIVRGGTTAWSTLLWPHRWSVYTTPAVYVNGKQLYDFNLQLEDFLPGSGVGVLAHEMFHTFGAPDLYHYVSNGISPVGYWDIMENNFNPPQHMSAFMKFKYGGWIASVPAITLPGTYTLNPLTSSTNNCYKIASAASSTEYFMLEYRKKSGIFENSLPGSGLIIYRINTLAGSGNAGGPPDEVYVYRPGGTTSANGTNSNAFFNSTVGRVTFNDASNPRDFLSNNANAGINIYNIGTAGSTISFQVGFSPIASFSASALVSCISQTITLTDNSSGTITGRSWTFAPNNVVYVGGTNANSQNPQVQFTSAGTYTVSLTITSASGNNTMTKSNYITISSPTATPFNENFESGSFSTNAWTLNNIDGDTTWSFKTGNLGNGSNSKSIWIEFYYYSNIGQIDELVSPPITLPATGTAKLKFKVAYRPYSAIYHDSLKVAIYTSCGATLAAIPYKKGDGTLATGAILGSPFIPSAASDWRADSIDLSSYMGQDVVVKFIAVNGYGNNLYLDDVNLVSVSTSVVSNFTANTTSICQNGSVSFTDQSTGTPTSWAWTFGDGGTSTLQNPTHQYLTSGIKTVSLTVTNSGGSNTMTKTNYIVVNPNLPVSVSIAASANPVCSGTSVTYTATPVNAGSSPIYQWYLGATPVGSNSTTYSYSPSNGDQLHVVLTSNAVCPTDNPATSNTLTMTVNSNLPVSVGIAASANPVCSGNSVTYTATPVNAGATPVYQWYLGATPVGSNSATYSYSPSNGDQLHVVLTSNAVCPTDNPATSNTLTMTVNSNLPVSVGIAASANPVCSGTSVTYTATPVNGGATPVYQWYLGATPVGSNSATYSYSPSNGDQLHVVLTSNAVCPTDNPATSNTLTMTVNSNLPVSVGIAASA